MASEITPSRVSYNGMQSTWHLISQGSSRGQIWGLLLKFFDFADHHYLSWSEILNTAEQFFNLHGIFKVTLQIYKAFKPYI